MGYPRGFALPAFVMTLAACVVGCSSGQDKTSQGSLAVALGASRVPAGVQSATPSLDDPTGRLKAANVTISDVEARRSDGTWIPIDRDLPAVIDLLALADGGVAANLPSGLLPEGHYSALQLRIAKIELTVRNGTPVTIAPPGAGWVVLIPVDFEVVIGQATNVTLKVRLDLSFRLVNGEFEFDPEVEVGSVEHD